MRWKPGIVFAVILLATAGAAETVFAQAQPLQTQPQPQTGAADFEKLYIDALGWLEGMIRIDTSNPPGNEMAAAKYLAGILQKEGIPAETYESAPGRGILIARLSANSMPDPSRALLLMGHLDVVGVDKLKWQVDPFGAVIQNGYLYGRGAIDDKGMTIANVAVMVALKRSNVRLTRDVILLAEGDEEQGGQAGMKFALDKYWEKIAAGFSLNEGGRVILKDGKVQYVGVQAAEKVFYNVAVTATGTSGHASVPRPDNAVIRLSAAIEKIGAVQMPAQLITITRRYFEGLAQIEDD